MSDVDTVAGKAPRTDAAGAPTHGGQPDAARYRLPADATVRRTVLRRRYRRRRIMVGAVAATVLAIAAMTGRALIRSDSSVVAASPAPTGVPAEADTPLPPTSAAPTTAVAPTTAATPSTTVAPSTAPPTTVAAPAPPGAAAPTGLIVGPLSGGPGPIPVIHRIPTFDPVVFITIDDGVTKDPAVLDIVRDRQVPVTQFLTEQYMGSDPSFFLQLQALGGVVGGHTRNHPHLTRLDDGAEADQVCTPAARFAEVFGAPIELFRPTYGEYDAQTVSAAASCGHRAVVHWSATFNKGHLSLQRGTALRPGDIVLLHFNDTLATDLPALLDLIAASGLRPAQLADYVRAAPSA